MTQATIEQGFALQSAIFTVRNVPGSDSKSTLSLIADCAVRRAVPTVVIGAEGQEGSLIMSLLKSLTDSAIDESGFVCADKVADVMTSARKIHDAPLLFLK